MRHKVMGNDEEPVVTTNDMAEVLSSLNRGIQEYTVDVRELIQI